MRFADKTVVITGGGSGIGRAAAELFAAEGAAVAINDVNLEAAERVAQEIKTRGANALAVACDVADGSAVSRAAADVMTRFGRIDILINSAGFGSHAPAEEYKQWDRMLAVNLSGVFHWCVAAARQSMIGQHAGSIVNVASLAGLAAHPGDVGYIASKHGVVGLTKALAVEWARYNIRVNCLCPGLTRTPIIENAEKAAPDRFVARRARIPLGREAEAAEQARAMLFLASSDASSVTGLIMPVDGGQMALSSGWLPLPVESPAPAP
jgi:NAD(P)-dependent dehydrogenase (short-subunit alcohol dehydrogenase family)